MGLLKSEITQRFRVDDDPRSQSTDSDSFRRRRSGTELALFMGMPAIRRPASRSLRILRRILRRTMLLPTAAGFLGGIIISILVVTAGSMAALLLAATTGVGATIVWWLRGAEERRIQRAMRERLQRRIHSARRSRLSQETTTEVEPETEGAGKPEELVVCHDFNAAQGHFDHWSA